MGKKIDWQIEQIRVTSFLHDSPNAAAIENWLQSASDNAPARVNKAPTTFSGLSTTDSGLLRVNLANKRLDVILTATPEQPETTIAPLSEVDAIAAKFLVPVGDIDSLPKVSRIAFGLVLSCNVTDEAEGLELLATNLSRVKISKTTRDFLYRVNEPTQSSVVKDLLLNRLATWLVGKVQVIQIELKADGTQSQKTLTDAPPFTVRVEMDLSTDASQTLEADPGTFKNVLLELKKIALDIAEHGEFALN